MDGKCYCGYCEICLGLKLSTPGPWYGKNNMNGQGLICQEITGKPVAVVYDVSDTALIAAAPEMHEILKEIDELCLSRLPIEKATWLKIIRVIKQAEELN